MPGGRVRCRLVVDDTNVEAVYAGVGAEADRCAPRRVIVVDNGKFAVGFDVNRKICSVQAERASERGRNDGRVQRNARREFCHSGGDVGFVDTLNFGESAVGKSGNLLSERFERVIVGVGVDVGNGFLNELIVGIGARDNEFGISHD